MRNGIDFSGFTNIQTVIFIMGYFSVINFALVTRKWKSKSSPIELVTQSGNRYFSTST